MCPRGRLENSPRYGALWLVLDTQPSLSEWGHHCYWLNAVRKGVLLIRLS